MVLEKFQPGQIISDITTLNVFNSLQSGALTFDAI